MTDVFEDGGGMLVTRWVGRSAGASKWERLSWQHVNKQSLQRGHTHGNGIGANRSMTRPRSAPGVAMRDARPSPTTVNHSNTVALFPLPASTLMLHGQPIEYSSDDAQSKLNFESWHNVKWLVLISSGLPPSQLITSRNSCMAAKLVQKSMTLIDLQRTNAYAIIKSATVDRLMSIILWRRLIVCNVLVCT